MYCPNSLINVVCLFLVSFYPTDVCGGIVFIMVSGWVCVSGGSISETIRCRMLILGSDVGAQLRSQPILRWAIAQLRILSWVAYLKIG